MSMTVQGLLWDRDMPANMKAARGVVRSFESVQAKFVGMATAAAQSGTDYDIPNEPDVYDQGDLGSCVLNATVGAINIILAVEKNMTSMLSRLFLYWLCREVMGTTTQDSGTYTHLAVERAGNIGIPSEAMWAYLDSNMYLP